MRALDLTDLEHPNFRFICKTLIRINHSIAWLVECKHCGKDQLVGSSQVKRGTHMRCIACQIPNETNKREV